MDYRELLSKHLSKSFIDEIVKDVLVNPDKFKTLFDLIFDEGKNVSWRAIWACEKVAKIRDDWFSKEHVLLLEKLCLTTDESGKKRLIILIFLHIPLAENINVDLINACFEWMISPKCPGGLQAVSMKYLAKVCTKIPELKYELIAYLEEVNSLEYTPAFIASRKNTLKLLKK